jgi:hypothetical protein
MSKEKFSGSFFLFQDLHVNLFRFLIHFGLIFLARYLICNIRNENRGQKMAQVASTGVSGLETGYGYDIQIAAPEERLLDRVYDFPEALPEKAMDMLVDLASDDSVSNREMDYVYFQVVTLPMMAASGMFADQKQRYLKENKCSFQDYIRYRLNRLNYMASNGYDRRFCERIRQLLWRFTVV